MSTPRSTSSHEEKHNWLGRSRRGQLRRSPLPITAGEYVTKPGISRAEGIWNDLRRVELGNVCYTNLDQLRRKLIQAKERLRHKKERHGTITVEVYKERREAWSAGPGVFVFLMG